jgi:hypothetical protein
MAAIHQADAIRGGVQDFEVSTAELGNHLSQQENPKDMLLGTSRKKFVVLSLVAVGLGRVVTACGDPIDKKDTEPLKELTETEIQKRLSETRVSFSIPGDPPYSYGHLFLGTNTAYIGTAGHVVAPRKNPDNTPYSGNINIQLHDGTTIKANTSQFDLVDGLAQAYQTQPGIRSFFQQSNVYDNKFIPLNLKFAADGFMLRAITAAEQGNKPHPILPAVDTSTYVVSTDIYYTITENGNLIKLTPLGTAGLLNIFQVNPSQGRNVVQPGISGTSIVDKYGRAISSVSSGDSSLPTGDILAGAPIFTSGLQGKK